MGWRPEIAPAILNNLHRIDVLEVLADDYFGASKRELDALRSLSREVPLILHGVGLGLAGTAPVPAKRLAAMARIFERVQPESWSEHLAFVRTRTVELGHLAAPPRNAVSVEVVAANIDQATRTVGVSPAMENIATLVEPPGSDLTELDWLQSILQACPSRLLLDLHNVHANALNHGYDAEAFLDSLPLGRVDSLHIAGGFWSEHDGVLVDDHLHPVPEAVYGLLVRFARRSGKPLTVILERDGRYGSMESLLAELDAARAALAGAESQAEEPAVEFRREALP
jgi:uncharacterized protein